MKYSHGLNKKIHHCHRKQTSKSKRSNKARKRAYTSFTHIEQPSQPKDSTKKREKNVYTKTCKSQEHSDKQSNNEWRKVKLKGWTSLPSFTKWKWTLELNKHL